MILLRGVLLALAIAGSGLPAPSAAAPFMKAGGFLGGSEEQRRLDAAERAHLADIRSRRQVIQATTGACDPSAFSSPSVDMDLPDGRAAVLSRTRQESRQFPGIDEHGTRIVTASTWIGRTDAGADAIFSLVGGVVAGQFLEAGDVVSVEQLNARLCIVIRYDSTRPAPPD
jgi:hypothetical protein